MGRQLLLYCPQMRGLAEELAAYAANQRLNRRDVVVMPPRLELSEIKWGHFPDTYPDILIHGLDHMIEDDVIFLAAFDNPGTIFEQMSVIYTLAEFGPRSLKILLPYYPTGTMERVDTEGQVATAATLAQMLSAVAPAGPGPVPLYIWDIHALPIRHYFGPNITPRFKTGLHILQNRIRDLDNVAIGFPDQGAHKRFKVMFTQRDPDTFWHFVVCNKTRDPNDKSKRVVTIAEGEPRGKHVVVVDDIGHSCGTLIECCKALLAKGAAAVSAYVTHGVMEQESWRKLLDCGFTHVWITNSCPETAAVVAGQGPFEVLSIIPSMYDAICNR